MGRLILIVVAGPPMGKPRMTQRDKWKQRDCVRRYRAWADHFRACIAEQVGQLPDVETVDSVSWTAYFTPPKSWSEKRKLESIGQQHRVKPDRDNIDKAVLDIMFKKDQAIATGTIKKRWGTKPMIMIELEVRS